MGPHQGTAEEENFPWPAGPTPLNAPQETTGLLGSKGTLLAHSELLVPSTPRSSHRQGSPRSAPSDERWGKSGGKAAGLSSAAPAACPAPRSGSGVFSHTPPRLPCTTKPCSQDLTPPPLPPPGKEPWLTLLALSEPGFPLACSAHAPRPPVSAGLLPVLLNKPTLLFTPDPHPSPGETGHLKSKESGSLKKR